MTAAGTPTHSAECTLAQRPGYEGLHTNCRRTEDIPLPHSPRIVLVPRCRCTCHRQPGGTS